jgi:hypothetical protein
MEPDHKHYLDSSIARPMLWGSSIYKEHLKKQFSGDKCYVNSYVQMELRRSFLRNVINFYFLLDMPEVPTLNDAIEIWSNKFKTSELKAVLQLVAQLAGTHVFELTRPEDKTRTLSALSMYIKRMDVKLRRAFTNISRDSTGCARAKIDLRDLKGSQAAGLRDFVDRFDNVEECRNNCHVDRFLLTNRAKEVREFIAQAGHLPNNDTTKGFIRIASSLNEIAEAGAQACSCKRCESIGDAVIALDAPRDMRLEHSDNSFNQLCPPLKQPHFHHSSEAAFAKEISSASPNDTEREEN